jgi:nicotinamidase-related amidase
MTVTTIDPKTALVVIDLQAGIVGAPTVPYPAADVVSRTAQLADAFRERGLPVVLVRVSTLPDGSDWAPGRIEGGAQRMTRPEGWDVIVKEITGPGDIVVTKRNWGAFYGTDLDLHLRRRGVTQIVLTGIATAIGVESTARSAHEHGYNVTVAVDAVSDLNEETHKNSVEKIFPRLGEVGTTAEIIDLVKKSS